MDRDQALAVLAQALNAPGVRLTFSIQELGACDLALRTLADASKPAPAPPGESPTPAP
jgi:hypothetical protein